MFWLTWRQHRWQLIAVAALVAVYCGYLLYTGFVVEQTLDACPSRDTVPRNPTTSCINAINSASETVNSASEVVIFGNLLPLAVGMFWGAPLIARELEQGTYRLAFTQSVSRRRWLAVKLGTLTAAAAILGLITGVVMTRAHSDFTPMLYATETFGDVGRFSQSGIVPTGTWTFALLLGASLGLLVRRSMVAVALTLVALPLVFVGLTMLRPHYLPPVERTLGSTDMIPDPSPVTSPLGWLYQMSYLDTAGNELDSQAAGEICADPANTYPTAECLRRTDLRQVIIYQPADRYVWFQLAETGLLLSASAALAVLTGRRISRHLN